MKPWLFLVTFIWLPALLISQELTVSLGADFSYSHVQQWLRVSDASGDESFTKDTQQLIGAELWVNASFVEVRGGYFHSLGGGRRIFNGAGSSDDEPQTMESTTAMLTWSVMGMYPFVYKKLTIAPLLGFTYVANLEYLRPEIPSGIPDLWTESENERDDLFLQGGFALDWDINKKVFVHFLGSLGMNVNSHREAAQNYADALGLNLEHGGFMVNLSMGLGYRL